MSTNGTRSGVRRQYAFIEAHRSKHSVQAMCRLLGVAPSGYYAWLAQRMSDHAKQAARLLRLIRASFTASQGIYGHRESSWTCARPAKDVASTASHG
jgi:putative transposase